MLEALEPALHAGVLIESPEGAGRFRCSHGLVHEVLYDDLGVVQRARLHSGRPSAGSAPPGTDGPHLITIAEHWFKAVPIAPPARAVSAAIEASHWGQAHVAHAQAEVLLLSAVDLLHDHAVQVEIEAAGGVDDVQLVGPPPRLEVADGGELRGAERTERGDGVIESIPWPASRTMRSGESDAA